MLQTTCLFLASFCLALFIFSGGGGGAENKVFAAVPEQPPFCNRRSLFPAVSMRAERVLSFFPPVLHPVRAKPRGTQNDGFPFGLFFYQADKATFRFKQEPPPSSPPNAQRASQLRAKPGSFAEQGMTLSSRFAASSQPPPTPLPQRPTPPLPPPPPPPTPTRVILFYYFASQLRSEAPMKRPASTAGPAAKKAKARLASRGQTGGAGGLEVWLKMNQLGVLQDLVFGSIQGAFEQPVCGQPDS